MSRFAKWSLWGGWVVFAISAAVYLLTIEPTASLWDCGEFIATSYKLEVGHPPGTPFFFLINRLACMLVGDSPMAAAAAINAMSALESAFTIAFLFWSIAHLGRRLLRREEGELSAGQTWAVIGAAAVGALAYTFSDTFWFSAVEAEVYALSSLFTAVVFWAILRWENVAAEPGSNRWLILIAYLMGLSIGAHILNLLAIPALVFIYYFKRFPGRPKAELWKPGAISVLLTGLFYGITPTVVSIGAGVDRMFVNGFGLGIGSGLAFFVALLLGLIAWGVYKTQRAGRVGWNTILVSAGMVIIGFSTYGIVLIRATAGTPMNNGDPSNPYALEAFINREQYGNRHSLVYGPSYASPEVDHVLDKDYFVDEKGEYKPMEKVSGYRYAPGTEMLFPRMGSSSASHIAEYKHWAGIDSISGVRTVFVTDRDADGRPTRYRVQLPTFWSNLKYFFGYQLNNMYWRYFLWNFVGRQSDIQNSGIVDGNWLSGLRAVDALYLGPQDGLPSEMANNKGRNTYYFLPFILGLVGFFYQLRRDGRNFLVVFLLFFMTGLAIILYLNQDPLQPRERDYAYAGSFYAFAIWIGIGILGLYEWVRKRVFKGADQGRMAAVIVTGIGLLAVPTLMAAQNWDDHDRSHRYVARDVGHNYLSGTLPDAILIDYGDNDTFPLWYAQEVEGVRTDVRVMNASYITGDWYIDLMRRRINESAPIPHSLPRSKYYGDARGSFLLLEGRLQKPGGWTAKEVMQFVNSDDPRTQVRGYDFIPTRRIALPVDKEKVLRSGIVRPEEAHLIEDTIYITLKQRTALNAGEMTLLDMLANNDWERPIYFTAATSMLDFDLVHLDGRSAGWSYLQQDGMIYRLVPIKSPVGRAIGRINTTDLYRNLMERYAYGNIKDPRVYVDHFTHYTFSAAQLRSTFARLATQLVQEGDTLRAVEVLDRAMTEMPLGQLRADDMLTDIVEAYYRAGAFEQGNALARQLADIWIEYLVYFRRPEFQTGRKRQAIIGEYRDKYRSFEELFLTVWQYKQQELVEYMEPYYE